VARGSSVNWFLFGIGVAYVGAALSSALRGRGLWAALFLLLAVADFILAILEANA
jgi:hypothetical protein